MDIDKVIENLREAKKKASCPPGFKYSKKMKSCVPIRKKGKYIGGRGYYVGGYRGGDNRSDSGNGNGKGNGNGNGGNGNGNGGNGNGGGNGGNGGGNGGGGNGGGGGE